MATTFRIVVTTQVHENYGAHNWDGEGECPQYWKAKGGNEYQQLVGTASEIAEMGSEQISAKVREFVAKITNKDDFFDEYVINWSLVPNTEETYGEKELREMLAEGYINQEAHDRRKAELVAVLG